jgi:hypothetical protein
MNPIDTLAAASIGITSISLGAAGWFAVKATGLRDELQMANRLLELRRQAIREFRQRSAAQQLELKAYRDADARRAAHLRNAARLGGIATAEKRRAGK